jgi:hypothetical protein
MRDTTQARQDRRFRESLEKASIDEGRANPVDALNKLAIQDGIQQSAEAVLVEAPGRSARPSQDRERLERETR